MEKKLGVFFTTIVTHINNTTLSIFSNPNTNIQTTLYIPFFLSLKYIHSCVSIYSPTHYLLPSIITSVPFFHLSASLVRLFLLRLCLTRVLDVLRGLHTLTYLNI